MTLKKISLLYYVPNKKADTRFDQNIKEELYLNLENTLTIKQISKTFEEITENLDIINIADSEWKSKLDINSLVFNYTYFDVFKKAVKTVLYLEENDINYIGATPKGYYIASDKQLSKRIISSFGYKTPKNIIIDSPIDIEEAQKISAMFSESEYLVIKPNNEEASVSIRLIKNNPKKIVSEIDTIFQRFRARYLIEEYIEGYDITVPMVGRDNPKVLLPLVLRKEEYHKEPFIFTAELKSSKKGLKWANGSSLFSEKIIRNITKLSTIAFKETFQRDFSRIDLRVTAKGEIYFLEINPNPQLNPVGGSFVDSAKLLDLPFSDVLRKMCMF